MSAQFTGAVQQSWRTALAAAWILAAIIGGCAGRGVDKNAAAPAASTPITAQQPEAVSLLGRPLFAPELAPEVRAQRERDLEIAQHEYDRDPHNEQAIIWLGRRLAYLGRYQQAIDVFSNGLAISPDSFRLLRHRGHRYITTRQFDRALADLQRAAELIKGVPDEVEPDGQPNRLNIPTSTTHTNIHYHLGLAHYLKGDFEAAERAYRRCMEFAANDDMRVATAYWLFLTLKRLDRRDGAQAVLQTIQSDMNIIENMSYHRLMLIFRGDLTPEQLTQSDAEDQSIDRATIEYGLGMQHLLQGETEKAREQFRSVIANTNWAAFGHLAAEVELARSDH